MVIEKRELTPEFKKDIKKAENLLQREIGIEKKEKYAKECCI